MSQSSGDHPLPPDAITERPPPPSGPRGYVLLSWLALLLIGGGFVFAQNFLKRGGDKGDNPKEAANLVVLEINMRMQIGVATSFAAEADKKQKVVDAVAGFNRGSIDQRLMTIICLGELLGPLESKLQLQKLNADLAEHGVNVKPEDRRHIDTLLNLYTDYVDGRADAPLVPPADRADLLKSFGWFGELALGPPIGAANEHREAALAAATHTMTVLFLAAAAVIGFFLMGSVILTAIVIAWIRGVWRRHLGPAVPHHGVYLETFVIWLVVYLALLLFGAPRMAIYMAAPLAGCVAMGTSLLVLVWPVLRGIRWKQVRQDIGWTMGPTPLLEPTFGFLSYFACYPFLLLGVIIMVATNRHTLSTPAGPTNPFEPDQTMAHPILHQLANGTMADWLPLFLLACVFAPIVEETAFRGLLYRHVRDGTRSWFVSFPLSVLVVSMLFAVVHPQGVMAVPLLTSLACAFALAREWRGTLIPGIMAHSLNNTMILAFAILCLAK